MTRHKQCSMLTLAILLIGLTSLDVTSFVHGQMDAKSNSAVGFCDGNYYVPKTRKSCNHGLTFGRRAPKCICIKGIYRMYLSNCEVADGFATEVCTLLQDPEQNITVKGVKLTREVKWDRTALVCEKGSGYNKDWDITAEGGTAHVGAKYFYTINGDALSSTAPIEQGKSKQQICIQRNMKQKNKICLYRHTDNVEMWHMEKSTIISIPSRPTCPEKKGPWAPMNARKCFDPLELIDSECQPACAKSNIHDRPGRDSEEEGPGDTPIFDTIEDANLDTNITDPRPYSDHDNDYLDRKLKTYWMLQELDAANITPVNTINHGPNKTFDLFEIMKNITKNYCPNKYVPRFWVEQVIELFHVLHHGDVFKYENELSIEEHKWIHDILLKCHASNKAITLVPNPDDNPGQPGITHPGTPSKYECDFGVKRAYGYCPSKYRGCGLADAISSPPSPLYADWDRKHYVPEVAWLVLDIVHVVCFPQFNESYRMFHLLEQTVEKLFTTQIINYWFNPSWSQKTKRAMLGWAADDYMWNMEVCTQGAYSINNNTVHRLVRPDPLKYISLSDLDRRKRSAADSKSKASLSSLSTGVDVFCPRSKSQFKMPDHCDNLKVKPNSIHKTQIFYVSPPKP